MAPFTDLKEGFLQILTDRHWPAKVLLAGFLLINPLLLALAPSVLSGAAPAWAHAAFPWLLGFNILSFWFPLGFTYEVLRRARRGSAPQLPDWSFALLPRYAFEGAVKFLIALFTLILPVGLWMGACLGLFVHLLGLPPSLLSLFLPAIMLFVIPFCGIACCRWLDGTPALVCALDYTGNFRLFRRSWKDYLLASCFLTGLNAVTTSLFYTIPFAAVFGLCLVDTWFGPIYARSIADPAFSQLPANTGVRGPLLPTN